MESFIKKYPLPWSFEQTDPSGAGVLLDANGQTMMIWNTDLDWEQDDETPETDRPVFNGAYDGYGDPGQDASDLVNFILERING